MFLWLPRCRGLSVVVQHPPIYPPSLQDASDMEEEEAAAEGQEQEGGGEEDENLDDEGKPVRRMVNMPR